jgi:NADH-quinone oxidoreductase subunit C
MSDEPKETGKEPAANHADNKDAGTGAAPVQAAAPQAPVNASPDVAAKAPAPQPAKPAPAKEAPVITPGEFGKALEKAKIPVKHLGADATGVEMLDIAPVDLLKAAAFLRDDCEFDFLLSCAGVDWKDRLESVYHLYSTKRHQYVAVKVTADNEHSPSLVPIWNAADWHERESFDLLGIHYDGHPNLTRILMPSDWLGYPLRKDYKVDDPRLVWNER